MWPRQVGGAVWPGVQLVSPSMGLGVAWDCGLPRLHSRNIHCTTSPPCADELRVRSWVSQATLHRKLGDSEAAVRLLRKAARAEPKVGWQCCWLPCLASPAVWPASR